MTVTGFGLNVQVAFCGQPLTLRVTAPVNPNDGAMVTLSVTVLPAVIGPNELLDMVRLKSGAFRVTLAVPCLPESITLEAMTVTVVSLGIELGAV